MVMKGKIMRDETDIIQEAKSVFDVEIEALLKTRNVLNQNFEEIINLLLHCKGKVVLTGIGKPGHIATKISATLASLGTPSFFLHPSEALHGDLGKVDARDVVMLLSYSGESEEVVRLLPALKEIKCVTIAITGKEKSTIAKLCDYKFIFPEFEEACYMHLAPTSSTTALLAFGDAMAVVISRIKNYNEDNFALHHPAGALGKKLLVKVKDIMHKDNENAIVIQGESLRNAIVIMTEKGLSIVTVVDEDFRLKGIITDGDIRRMLEKGVDVYTELVDSVMNRNPYWIEQRELAVNALQKMSELKITFMPVLNDEKKIVGSVLMQDIIKAGIVR